MLPLMIPGSAAARGWRRSGVTVWRAGWGSIDFVTGGLQVPTPVDEPPDGETLRVAQTTANRYLRRFMESDSAPTPDPRSTPLMVERNGPGLNRR